MKTMTMPKQHEWILPALAFAVLAMAGLLFKFDQRLPEVVWEGRDLIAGFEPKDLTKITLKTSSKTFSILKEGNEFVVDSQNSAPVNPQKLNEIILRLGGAQISEVIGKKSDWDAMHVSDQNAELTVELFLRSDAPKWKIFLGKSVVGKPGRAVRVAGKDDVLATSEYLSIPLIDTDFVSQEAISIGKSDVKSMDVYFEGKKLEDTKFIKDDLLSSLEPLKVKAHYKTGALPNELLDLQWNWTSQLLRENGQIYNISWAFKDGRWFAKAQSTLNQSFTDVSPLIDIKLLALKADVDKFNQHKMPWIWELSSESVDKLTRGLMYGEKKKDNKVSKK